MTTPDERSGITPWPVPDATAHAIVFGGSFDPPTRAHIDLALAARDLIDPAAWLVLVPAARSPHKHDGPLAPGADRVAMLAIALRDAPNTAIWTDELDRAADGVASYMVTTLERAAEVAPTAHLRLLIGADQAVAFHRWRAPRRIIELAEPAVILRAPVLSREAFADALIEARDWSSEEITRWLSRLLPLPPIDASATEARDLLEQNESTSCNRGRLQEVLDDRVLEYIAQRGLYGFTRPAS